MAAEQRGFSKESGWVILSDVEARIKEKIERIGTPLKNWNIQINYGIKTGYNEAFIIDSAKREELLKNCPKADEIIRPIIRGRDIKKYKINFANKWLINTHNGTNNTPRIDVEHQYPAVYDFLSSHKEKLVSRYDKGNVWTNLRNCAYLNEFEKEKIVWIELSDTPQFAYDEKGYFVEATAFLMTGSNLKYLTAFLNSPVCDWYFDKITTTSGVGTNRWKKVYIEELRIPLVEKDVEIYIADLIDQIREKDNLETRSLINNVILDFYGFDIEEKEVLNSFRKS